MDPNSLEAEPWTAGPRRQCREREVARLAEEPEGAEEPDEELKIDWSYYPEEVSSIVVHHDSILRNKRVLLTYL